MREIQLHVAIDVANREKIREKKRKTLNYNVKITELYICARHRPMSVPGSRVSSTASSVESVLLISNWKELESVGKMVSYV